MIDMKKLREYAEQNFDDLNLAHTKNVVELALKIAEKEEADKEIVEAAAWLHDIGKTDKETTNTPFRHHKDSVKIARKLLEEQGVDKKTIEKVCKCINEHMGPRGELFWKRVEKESIPKEEIPSPSTKESKCVYDADMVDFCGPFGIAKVIFLEAGKGRSFRDIIRERKQLTEDSYAEMQTDAGKEMGKEYYDIAKKFFKKLNMEEW